MKANEKTQDATQDATPPSRKPWVEPAITVERALEVHADGPLGQNPYGTSFLGPLYASQNSGFCY